MRRTPLLLLALALVALMAIYLVMRSGDGGDPGDLGLPTPDGEVSPTGGGDRSNPFGMVVSRRLPEDLRVRIAETMGARYYRTMAAIVGDQTSYFDDIDALRAAGLTIVLDVRSFENDPFPLTNGFPTEIFPVDLDAYRAGVARAIDETDPAVIVVGNESAIPESFSGTVEEYRTMLEAACEVSRGEDVPCSSDGMLFSSVALYTYYHLYFVVGDQERAEAFREQAFEDFLARLSPEDIRSRVESRLVPWLEAYTNAQPDFVNIHWYSFKGADPAGNAAAFAQAVAVFEEVTGRPVITNETGVRDLSPEVVTCRMRTIVQLGMPYAIWYNSDAGARGPQALSEEDGSLRPTGQAFRAFAEAIRSKEPLPPCG